MTTQQTISKIATTFDINAIYARHLLHIAPKDDLFDHRAKLLQEKPKSFVKWTRNTILYV